MLNLRNQINELMDAKRYNEAEALQLKTRDMYQKVIAAHNDLDNALKSRELAKSKLAKEKKKGALFASVPHIHQ